MVKCLKHSFSTPRNENPTIQFISAAMHLVFVIGLFIFVLKTGAFNNA